MKPLLPTAVRVPATGLPPTVKVILVPVRLPASSVLSVVMLMSLKVMGDTVLSPFAGKVETSAGMAQAASAKGCEAAVWLLLLGQVTVMLGMAGGGVVCLLVSALPPQPVSKAAMNTRAKSAATLSAMQLGLILKAHPFVLS